MVSYFDMHQRNRLLVKNSDVQSPNIPILKSIKAFKETQGEELQLGLMTSVR